MGAISCPGSLNTNLGVGVFVVVDVGGSNVTVAVLVGWVVWVAIGGATVTVGSLVDVTVIVEIELP